jgi:hypothetical protein
VGFRICIGSALPNQLPGRGNGRFASRTRLSHCRKEEKNPGAVRLDIVVGKDGHVLSIKTISGNSLLADAARQAATQWVYKPTLLNGEPIVVIIEVCVPFVLTESRHKVSPCRKGPIRCG